MTKSSRSKPRALPRWISSNNKHFSGSGVWGPFSTSVVSLSSYASRDYRFDAIACLAIFVIVCFRINASFFLVASRRSARDDNLVTTNMTNGFGSPPKIDPRYQQHQHQLQLQRERPRNASDDYLDMSATKIRSNNVNGATVLLDSTREQDAPARPSQCLENVADDIGVPPKSAFTSASASDLVTALRPNL